MLKKLHAFHSQNVRVQLAALTNVGERKMWRDGEVETGLRHPALSVKMLNGSCLILWIKWHFFLWLIFSLCLFSVPRTQQGNSIFTGSFTRGPQHPTHWVGLALASAPTAPPETGEASTGAYTTNHSVTTGSKRTTTRDPWGKCPPVFSNTAVSLFFVFRWEKIPFSFSKASCWLVLLFYFILVIM